MKIRYALLLAIPLILACSTTFPGRLLDPEAGTDPGLLMYRHPWTRRAVETFYAEVAGSSGVSRAILRHADTNGIPLALAFALAWGESQFNVRALNCNPHSVDRGLYQLNSKTFPQLKAEEFYDPEISAEYGLRHMRFCLNQAESELVALAIYNAGSRKVLNKGTPYSTLNHIARILEYREKLEELFLLAMAAEAPLVLL